MCSANQYRFWARIGVLIAASLLSGCEAKPRAPALTDEPVFQNDQFGLRMLAPERWKQIANALIPPGVHEKPMQMVGYRSPQMNAAFEILVVDAPENADMQSVALEPSHGVSQWRLVGKPEPTTVGSVPAIRYRLSGMLGGVNQTKDVVTVRRAGRFLMFVLIAPANDVLAGEAVRQAIGSVTWRD